MTICVWCIGMGWVNARPDQLAWLRRRDLETVRGEHIFELPGGSFQILAYPYVLRVKCPKCNPRKRYQPPDEPVLVQA